VGSNAFRLNLPPYPCIHDVVNASQLKLYSHLEEEIVVIHLETTISDFQPALTKGTLLDAHTSTTRQR
jgi:hypothetical protein